jgi:uncharacterized membrane protein
MSAFRVRANLRNSVWFVPVLCVLGGVALSFATIAVDRITDFGLVPASLTGGPDEATSILSTIATAEVTLLALVLTVTMVVVQLAMGQFSPRIVQTFLQDKPSQIAIGLFVATFAHAMLAMREVNTTAKTVPGVAIVVAFVLVVLSIVVLVVYVDHIGKSLRVSSLIELVGKATRRTLDERYPAGGGSPQSDGQREEPPAAVIRAPHSGVLSRVDGDKLVAAAEDADVLLELHVGLGAFVPAGAALVTVHGERELLEDRQVMSAIVLGLDRDLDQDVAYGLRLLVDIAERSLADSPFLDPTTAVQALDRLHDCLRQLAPRTFPSGRLVDGEGQPRVDIPVMDWDDYVRLAFEEIRLAGAGSPQVARRLEEVLRDLLSVAPPERRPVLETELDLLRGAVNERYADPRDVTFALAPDRQGLGLGPPRSEQPTVEEVTEASVTRPS